MENKNAEQSEFPLGFALYMLLISAWLAPITLAPFLLQQNSPLAPVIYEVYGHPLVCHELNSRSLCYFPNNSSIRDCTNDSAHLEYTKTPEVVLGNSAGYKFPVCARDIGIYYAMFLGGILVFLAGRHKSKDWPSVLTLIAASIPMVIDGGTQLIGLRESSNYLRLATGFIVGIALPFYFIPLLNNLLDGIKLRLGK